ncbi:MAG: hypothetical protein AB1512_08125 [Thermodesulfobacteriota bacterium]
MNRLMVVLTPVIPRKGAGIFDRPKRTPDSIRGGIQRLYWMPEQVRHDDTIMRRFINGRNKYI